MAGAPINSDRVIGDLRELARRTSDERGAQRVAWTPCWQDARGFLRELLGDLGLELEVDEAGNGWARLEGEDSGLPALVVGSHLDSVPDGGWLDGALGAMSALGALRSWSEKRPARDLVLVDWADEEGARFGRSLFGSSAFSGSLDPAELGGLADADGVPIGDALAEHGVEVDRLGQCASRRDGLGAYLELHVEQGPVLEAEGLAAAAVDGCQGVERVHFTFRGEASHAGTTPMDMRSDAGLAAARTALAIAELPERHGGVATTGELRLEPGIATAVAGLARLSCDLRNPDLNALGRMLAEASDAAARAASAHGVEFEQSAVWRIDPTRFDPGLVAAAAESVAAVTGTARTLTSGALHDAAEVARVLPAAMIFSSSAAGVSHNASEDTKEDDLHQAIAAYGDAVNRVMEDGHT